MYLLARVGARWVDTLHNDKGYSYHVVTSLPKLHRAYWEGSDHWVLHERGSDELDVLWVAEELSELQTWLQVNQADCHVAPRS